MRFFSALSLFLLLSVGCASSGGLAARTWERPLLAELKLADVDVVVVVAPPVASPPSFNVSAFQPPAASEPLGLAAEDAATRDALVEVLRARLQQAGYRARFIYTGGAEQPAITVSPPIETSTSPVALPGGVRIAESVPAERMPMITSSTLKPTATLGEVLSASDADAVLVVRAVPVDAFWVYTQSTNLRVLDNGAGQITPLPPAAPVMWTGRLMVGQAFLFDRRTGLRLWTRQLPDYPESGQLRPDDPFFAYGVITRPGEQELLPADKATRAASAFAEKMFQRFPSARAEGSATARATLDAIDPNDEVVRQGFLDDAHFGLEVGVAYSGESVGTDLVLDEVALPALGTGAIAPSGIVRVTPRVAYLAPGGLAISLGVPIGKAPGRFRRSYHRDNPDPDGADPDDRSTSVEIAGPLTIGAELQVGYAFHLSPTVLLEPSVGTFFDLWIMDASPTSVVPDDQHLRLGALGRLDVLFRFSETSPLYVRTGGGLRLGFDLQGPGILGGELSASVGLFL